MCAMSTMNAAPDFVRDLAERRVVHRTRIRARARDDQLRLVFAREPRHLVVVDQFGVLADAVGDARVELAAETDLRAVRQVAAVRERHAEHGVARLQHRHEDGHVRLRARVRLDVRVLRTEQPLRAVDRQALGLVDVLAAAVVAAPGIAFGVLIGHHGGRRFAHGAARVVLGRDQLEIVQLARFLAADGRRHLRVLRCDLTGLQYLHRPVTFRLC